MVESVAVVLVPLIVGVVQAVKVCGLPGRWAAVVALALGIAGVCGAELYVPSPNWFLAVEVGVGVGLSAAGLYSGGVAVGRGTDSGVVAPGPPGPNGGGLAPAGAPPPPSGAPSPPVGPVGVVTEVVGG